MPSALDNATIPLSHFAGLSLLKGIYMTIDLMALAATAVTSFLVPYVKIGARKIVEAFSSRMGEQTADKLSDLTGKVWSTVLMAA